MKQILNSLIDTRYLRVAEFCQASQARRGEDARQRGRQPRGRTDESLFKSIWRSNDSENV
eukprot:2217968-Pleurochrysis_carterae.AAC.1